MRAILVDWLVEVHMKLSLSHNTLFLSVQLMDIYLSKIQIQRNQFQLLGVTCLFIASKYEDIDPPTLQQILYICKGTYTPQQLKLLEHQILLLIDYNLFIATPIQFLQFYSVHYHLDKNKEKLAKMILELTLLDSNLFMCKSSDLAIAALSFASYYLYNKIEN
jgi:hypothetical protein